MSADDIAGAVGGVMATIIGIGTAVTMLRNEDREIRLMASNVAVLAIIPLVWASFCIARLFGASK